MPEKYENITLYLDPKDSNDKKIIAGYIAGGWEQVEEPENTSSLSPSTLSKFSLRKKIVK